MIRVRNQKSVCLFLNQNIGYGCSQEPSQRDGYSEPPKHMLKLIDKTILLFI